MKQTHRHIHRHKRTHAYGHIRTDIQANACTHAHAYRHRQTLIVCGVPVTHKGECSNTFCQPLPHYTNVTAVEFDYEKPDTMSAALKSTLTF